MLHLITLHTKSSHSKAYSYIWNKWRIQKKMYTSNKPHILLCNVDLPASFLRHRERCTGWWVAYEEGKKGETQERDGRSWGLKRRNEIWNLHWGLLNYNVTWLNRKPLIESALYEGTHIYLIVHIVYCWANIIGCTKRNTFSRLCDFFGETCRIHIKEYK